MLYVKLKEIRPPWGVLTLLEYDQCFKCHSVYDYKEPLKLPDSDVDLPFLSEECLIKAATTKHLAKDKNVQKL